MLSVNEPAQFWDEWLFTNKYSKQPERPCQTKQSLLIYKKKKGS